MEPKSFKEMIEAASLYLPFFNFDSHEPTINKKKFEFLLKSLDIKFCFNLIDPFGFNVIYCVFDVLM